MNLIVRLLMSIIMTFFAILPSSCMEQKEIYDYITLEDIDNGSDKITRDTVLPLECMNKERVEVPLSRLRYSETLEHVFQDTGIQRAINGSTITIVPTLLSNADSNVITFIFTVLVACLENKNLTKEMLYEFCLDKDIDFIVDVIKTVNYLDIKDNLLAMLIQYAAHRIKKDPINNNIHHRITHARKDIPLPLLRMLCNNFTPLIMDVEILHKDDLHMSDARCLYSLVTKAGVRIAVGSQAGELSISDDTGKKIITWQAHEEPINAVYLFETEEDLLILTGSDDMTLCVWDIKGTLLARCKGHTQEVSAVCAVALGKEIVLVSGSYDSTVCLWNIDGSLRATYKGHPQDITAVFAATTKKGCFVISGSKDGTVCVCDSNAHLIVTFKGHAHVVTAVSAVETPDCILFASAARDKTVRLWNMQGKELALCDLHKRVIEYISLSKVAEDTKLVCASDDGAVYIYNTTGELHSTCIPHKEQLLSSVAVFCGNGLRVVYGHCNGFMSICKTVLSLEKDINHINRKQAEKIYELVTSIKDEQTLYDEIQIAVAKPARSLCIKKAAICFGLVCAVCSYMSYVFVK